LSSPDVLFVNFQIIKYPEIVPVDVTHPNAVYNMNEKLPSSGRKMFEGEKARLRLRLAESEAIAQLPRNFLMYM
jgi:hypothetical protein